MPGTVGERARELDRRTSRVLGPASDDDPELVGRLAPLPNFFDLAIPHESLPNVWTYTQPKTGDRLHAKDLDYTTTPDYYKGDPNGGYKSYVFTDHLSGEEIVKLRDKVEADTRKALGIPYNTSHPAIRYEHSMGQGLPASLFRMTGDAPEDSAALISI